MIALIIKLFTMVWPFIKELIKGDKRYNRRESSLLPFVIMAILIFIMFSLLHVNNSNYYNVKTELNNVKTELQVLKDKPPSMEACSVLIKENQRIIEDLKKDLVAANNRIDDLHSIIESSKSKPTVIVRDPRNKETYDPTETNDHLRKDFEKVIE